MSTTFEHWKIDNLKNHHLNAEVFGQLSVEADCTEFVESIKRNGIVQPLIVVPDGPQKASGTIIAGHRRMQGAARAGLKEVPVIVRRDLKTQLDIDRVWFETNRNREMTTEQKARWFTKRQAIESEAAKSRQSAAGGKSPGSASTKSSGSASGEAAAIAAKDVGLSRDTAKAAAAVVEVIDQAEAKGDRETAAKLRETLNGKSVAAAKREADKVKPPPEKLKPRKKGAGTSPAKLVDELSKKHVAALVRGIDAVAEVNGGKGLAHVCANDALNDLIAALKRMRGGEK